MDRLKPYRVLVVCTGNICRSPMAEGMIKAFLPYGLRGRIEVSSAGTHAIHGNVPSENAVRVMQSWGIDITSHRARMLSRSMVKQADLVLVMEKNHAAYIRFMPYFGTKKIRLISEFDAGGVPTDLPDPIGGDMKLYRATALLLKKCVKGVIEHLEQTLEV